MHRSVHYLRRRSDPGWWYALSAYIEVVYDAIRSLIISSVYLSPTLAEMQTDAFADRLIAQLNEQVFSKANDSSMGASVRDALRVNLHKTSVLTRDSVQVVAAPLVLAQKERKSATQINPRQYVPMVNPTVPVSFFRDVRVRLSRPFVIFYHLPPFSDASSCPVSHAITPRHFSRPR